MIIDIKDDALVWFASLDPFWSNVVVGTAGVLAATIAVLALRLLWGAYTKRSVVEKLVILHIAAAFGLAALWYEGLLFLPFEQDKTHMSAVIAAVFVVGVILAFLKRWEWVRRTAEILPALGLTGTILGFLIMLKGGVSAEDLTGVYTALFTTLVGMIGMIWLTLCRWTGQ